MANLQIIRDLAKDNNVSLKELAIAIGITESGLQNILRNNSTSIETLEKVAKYFAVPISMFFEPDETEISNGNWQKISSILGTFLIDDISLIESLYDKGVNNEPISKDDLTKLKQIIIKYYHLDNADFEALHELALIPHHSLNKIKILLNEYMNHGTLLKNLPK